ncbi:hypothetical protein N431DRAFT_398071 [Stipitochalara longipes BDJ]|nr:hypothetical protein N431DRAFT_398071 [Stipitochalara longipes BDJ]
MADQVSVAENIERVSTAGFELAQQLHGVSASGKEIQEEINSFRSQLQSLDVLLATSFDESSDLMDEVLENTLKEGRPCSRNASINEVSFSPISTPPFSPRMAFHRETDHNHAARNLDLETDCQSCSSSFTEGDFHDVDLDDLDCNREDATHLLLGDIQIFSPTQSLAQSMLDSDQLELRAPTPQTENQDLESSPRIQITHASDTGLKSPIPLSHSRRISGCSTLQGSVHEDEEFPMRKDGNGDVIQVIEIPLKSPGRKRGSKASWAGVICICGMAWTGLGIPIEGGLGVYRGLN